LARQVGLAGKSYPAVYNAANEQAVMAFHQGAISFDQITDLIERAVEAHAPEQELTLESVLTAEQWARDRTDAQIAKAC
jgi:1-deoxy-D-xylulose-5-phosphate reductoisomerase